MDAGVGSFVFSLGIISALPILKRLSVLAPQPLLIELWRSTRKTVPLCLLGLIRIVFVKGVDYPEHVCEYGVHWNFFFTLSILPLTGVLHSTAALRGLAGQPSLDRRPDRHSPPMPS